MGVKVPKMRLVDYFCKTTDEWHVIKRVLFPLALKKNGEAEKVKVKKELNRAFFLVMELAPGKPLDNLTAREASTFALRSTLQVTCAEDVHEAEHANRAVRELGRLIALDILCNNWDRIPLLWPNEGNVHNIFFDVEDRSVYGIDNSMATIPKGPKRDAYIARLRKVLSNITAAPSVVCEEMAAVRQFLAACTAVPATVATCVQLQLGLLEGVCDAHLGLDFDAATSPVALKESVRNMIAMDWENVWANELKIIDTSFHDEVLAVFAEFYPKVDAILHEWPVSRSFVSYNDGLSSEYGHDAVKILVMQERNYGDLKCAQLLDDYLSQGWSGRKPDIVLYPENWMQGGAVSQSHTTIAAFSRVAAKHRAYVLLGTMVERGAGAHTYVTSVLLGPDGCIAGTYRKQRPGSGYDHGTTPGVFETPFGRIAVLICFDIENDDVLRATLDLRPFLVLNPVWISLPDTDAMSRTSKRTCAVARDAMRRKFEAFMGEQMVTLVRCDQPHFLGATGSSQLIGPYCSVLSPNNGECRFSASVDTSLRNFWQGSVPPRPRTAKEDNTGNRYIVHVLQPPTLYGGGRAPAAVEHVTVLGPKTVATISRSCADVRIFDVDTGDITATLRAPDTVTCVTAAAADTVLALCAVRPLLCTWFVRLSEGVLAEEARFCDLPEPAFSIIVTEAGLVLGHAGALSLWSAPAREHSARQLAYVALPQSRTPVKFLVSVSASSLLAVHEDGCVASVQISGGHLVCSAVSAAPPPLPTCVTWCCGALWVGCSDGALRRIVPDASSAAATVAIAAGGAAVTGLCAVSWCGPWLVVATAACEDNLLLVWVGESGSAEVRHVFRGHTAALTCLACGGGVLASGDLHGEVRVHEFVQNAVPVGLAAMLAGAT
eukprot:TRINITY_DN517_c1_g1_i1.p1 TRINITY_DN517_c1_g1~~TRINITY_DN517_c1_g1_i1.p1  ORF type:complete len:959 (-),score=233.08 TRINITY_DN517_c1_g1_i1:75-2735(-)